MFEFAVEVRALQADFLGDAAHVLPFLGDMVFEIAAFQLFTQFAQRHIKVETADDFGGDCRPLLPQCGNDRLLVDFLSVCFQHHADFDQQTRALCTERQTLVQRLQAMQGSQGLSHVYPTAANFVLVRLAGGQGDGAGPSRATRVAAAMRAAGVLIKDASRMHPALAECLRLTVGAPEENEAMLQALAAALDAVPAASAGQVDGAGRTADANGRANGERTSS